MVWVRERNQLRTVRDHGIVRSKNVDWGKTLLITIYNGYASLLSHVVVSLNTQCPLFAPLSGTGGDAAMSGVACGTTLSDASHVGATSCTMI